MTLLPRSSSRPAVLVMGLVARCMALVAASSLALPGCVFDAGDVCGPNQHEGPMATCLCDKGYAADEDRVCRKQKINPKALGLPCDTASTPCTDPKYSECHVTAATSGYCTNAGCKSTKDCDGEYYCDDTAGPSYCKRPPTGQAMDCTGPADCAGFEANYCLVNPVKSSCLVSNCKSDADCVPGWTCEDYSSVLPGTPTICITTM